jgi:hypothetical protein
MNNWNRVNPRQSGTVKIWADGTIAIPKAVATRFIDPDLDRAAIYHNGNSIAIRAGADPDTTFSIQSDSNYIAVRAKSAVLSAIGELPDSSTSVPSEIVDAEIGVILKIDLSEVNEND